jgi:hypothetical protein
MLKMIRFRSVITVLLGLLFSNTLDAGSVREFGAIGDGSTDDTAAIRSAVTQIGETVEFPKGTYRITSTIVIDLEQVQRLSLVGDGTATIVMAGLGPAFRFSGTHAGTADPSTVNPNVWQRQRMPIVRGLEIVGDHEDADGIRISGVMQLTISETLIRNCRHAIHLTDRNRNVIISTCHLYHNRGVGVFYDHVNLHQSNVIGTHISYCSGGGIVTKGGEIRNIQIGTCDLESNMSPDAEPAANVLLDSTDGSTDEVAITGCTLQHNSKSAGSANIRVIGQGITSAREKTVTREGHIAITGNVMSDVQVNVHLQHARGVTITGNTFWEGFEDDLLIEDCEAIVVGPNDFDRNPRYVVNGNWGKDRNGLRLLRSSDCKLNGLLVKGVANKDAAVLLDRCNRCTITDLSILDCDAIGLQLTNCTRCKVSDCLIRDDREGKRATLSLNVSGGQQNWVRGNILANGVKIEPTAATVDANSQ